MKPKQLNTLAWALGLLVISLAVVAWGQGLSWRLSTMTAYDLFPLFGLTAFSLMWTQYVLSAARQYLGINKKYLQKYTEVSGLVVLLAILAHPGTLEWKLWKDGFGLPPSSVWHYVAPDVRIFTTLGMICLLVFLAYELRRWFEHRRWWHYFGYVVDVATLAIYVHSVKLGHTLRAGWLRDVWLFYGITLITAMTYLYVRRFNTPDKVASAR